MALGPRLHLIRPVFGQAYLWRDDDGVTLVDTGIPGSETAFATAFDELGLRRTNLRRIVIPHGHEDHTGAAGALRAWGEVTVFAHRSDAPIVRGLRRRAEPVLTPAERPIYAEVTANMPAVPPCAVDVEVVNGDTVDFGGGARVIATPGHTDGSIAVSLPTTGCCSPATSSRTPTGAPARAVQHRRRPGPPLVCRAHRDPCRDRLLRTRRPALRAGRRSGLATAGRALRGGPGRRARPARVSRPRLASAGWQMYPAGAAPTVAAHPVEGELA